MNEVEAGGERFTVTNFTSFVMDTIFVDRPGTRLRNSKCFLPALRKRLRTWGSCLYRIVTTKSAKPRPD